MKIYSMEKIYLMGIKGVAMAGLAVVLKKMGCDVLGSDVEEYFHTEDNLKKMGIPILKGFDPSNVIPDITAMVITGAHGGFENIEAKQAKNLNIPVFTHAEFIGQLMNDYQNRIVVCGSHGKTTITAMASYVFKKCNLSPTYFAGTSDFSGIDASDFGDKKYFIIEGDEYGNAPPKDLRPRFSFFAPTHVVCPNIDFDHPDIYKDLEDLKSKILDYYKKHNPYLIAYGEDKNFQSIKPYLSKAKVLTYGFEKTNDLVIENIDLIKKTKFSLTYKGRSLGEFEISIPGSQNVQNACGVILLALQLGPDIAEVKKSIKGFVGARRRFEKICEYGETVLYDDYAHHPREIEETIKAIKNYFFDKKLLLIFQPHTYSRTYSLLPDFVESLSMADFTITTDIFASARENKADFPIRSDDIEKKAKSLGHKNIRFVAWDDLLTEISKIYQNYDVIFTMGAGDLYKIHKELCELLNSKSTTSWSFQEVVKRDVLLKDYVTFKMGGLAEYFIEVKTDEELRNALLFAKQKNIPYYLLSGGSNIIFSNEKIYGLVILNRIANKKIISQTESELILEVTSGYPLGKLINELVSDGWSGFEWFAGMPGSVGGAVYMNSKWMRGEAHYISDNLIYAQIMDKTNGEIRQVDKTYLDFGYGYSHLQKSGDILISAQFIFKKEDSKKLKESATQIISYRSNTQPKNGFTAGCFFKNADGVSAGKLIDEAGLKDKQVGEFFVSDIHANFIIHKGNGKIEDLNQLIKLIRDRVRKVHGVELEDEVQIIN